MKLIFLFLSIFSTNVLFSQNENVFAPDYAGRINEYMLNIVVNIDHVTSTKRPGFDTLETFTGTGFVVNQGNKIFLVTNKHMIGSWSYLSPFVLSDSITVHFYARAQNSNVPVVIHLKDKKGITSPNVKIHGLNDVDVAVVNITEVFKDSNISKSFVGTGLLVPLSEVKEKTILGFGSQVFTIGYPGGNKMALSNYPIAKSGYIASTLSGKLEIEIGTVHKNGKQTERNLSCKFFLVDGIIIPGNSGGPIICPKDFYYAVTDKAKHVAGIKYKPYNYIIGIVSSIFPNTGLTIIYPTDYIQELIDTF